MYDITTKLVNIHITSVDTCTLVTDYNFVWTGRVEMLQDFKTWMYVLINSL